MLKQARLSFSKVVIIGGMHGISIEERIILLHKAYGIQ